MTCHIELTPSCVTQPCVGQVLGDSFAEIQSLGAPEHFCEDELLFILNSDKWWGPVSTLLQYLSWKLLKYMLSAPPRTRNNDVLLLFLRKSLTLKYYAKKILYFLRQQNILRSLKLFLEQSPVQQSALEGTGINCYQFIPCWILIMVFHFGGLYFACGLVVVLTLDGWGVVVNVSRRFFIRLYLCLLTTVT